MKFIITILLSLLISCSLEPKYITPKSPIPLNDSGGDTFQIKFIDFFQNDEIKAIVNIALQNNKDIQLASVNIETAIETFNVKRADLLPSFGIVASDAAQGAPPAFAAFTPKNTYRSNITLTTFELDFFGKLRNLKKSAKQSYLATSEARNVVMTLIVSQTVNAYLQLIADKQSIGITQNAMQEQRNKLLILQQRYENGHISNAELIAEKIVLETMKASETSYQRLFAQDLHLLMLLTASFDEKKLKPYFENIQIDEVKFNVKSLINIPSSALLNRPDIKQAEFKLKAMNANIGVARAAFFPSILLTGNYGYTSRDFTTLFDNSSWAFTPQVNIPIFTAGRNMANLSIAKLQKKTEIINYEKAIQVAFREFLDASSNYQNSNIQLVNYQNIVELNEQMHKIVKHKMADGITDSIILANSSIQLLSSKQNLVNQKKESLASTVAIYKSLGGGGN